MGSLVAMSVARAIGGEWWVNFLSVHVFRPYILSNPLELGLLVGWVLVAGWLTHRVGGLALVWLVVFALFFGGLVNDFVTIGVCCVGPTNSLNELITNVGLAGAAAFGFAIVIGTLGYILHSFIARGRHYQLDSAQQPR